MCEYVKIYIENVICEERNFLTPLMNWSVKRNNASLRFLVLNFKIESENLIFNILQLLFTVKALVEKNDYIVQ